MKKHLAAIASALVVTCTPAFAQTAATPAPSANPAVVEATKQMLASMKARETMAASLRMVEQQIPVQVQASMTMAIKNNPKLTEAQKADALKKLDQSLPETRARLHAVFADPTLVDDMVAEIVPLYADTYTLDEIHQLTAFYASPLGQKMLATMPTLMSRSMEIGNRVMAPRIQKAMAQSAQAVASH